MQRVEKTVFLSYRRADRYPALLIFKDLTQHGYDVFMDYDGIASGDFERSIVNNIHARAHFIVLLTPTALDRCTDPADWLRREIETALATQRNIVPLHLDGFSFGAPGVVDKLTGSLSGLRLYQALDVPATYFDAAMERLRRRFLDAAVDAVLHPASVYAQRVAQEQQRAAASASGVALVAVSVPPAPAQHGPPLAHPPIPSPGSATQPARAPEPAGVPAPAAVPGPEPVPSPSPLPSPAPSPSPAPAFPPASAPASAPAPTAAAPLGLAEPVGSSLASTHNSQFWALVALLGLSVIAFLVFKPAATTEEPAAKPTQLVQPLPVAARLPLAGRVFKDCAECPEMVVIPAGSFLMGSPAGEPGRENDEGPKRSVTFARYALGKTEVTQSQWLALMGNNPSVFKECGGDCPVENVSWDDAQAYIRKLNEKTGKTYVSSPGYFSTRLTNNSGFSLRHFCSA